MYRILCFIIAVILFSCNTKNDQKNAVGEFIDKIEIISKQNNADYPKDYAVFLKSLVLEQLTPSQKSERFFVFINNDVPYYWTGTKWDFNGTTRIPKEGNIACGYFITNVLSDFGFNIKRVYLAQQASSVMIKTLCEQKSIKNFASIVNLKQYIQQGKEKEIFIVGLDFHTGFIIKDENDIYFLHSNYINKSGVTKEKLDDSKALKQSKSFMIGSLTKNVSLFK